MFKKKKYNIHELHVVTDEEQKIEEKYIEVLKLIR